MEGYEKLDLADWEDALFWLECLTIEQRKWLQNYLELDPELRGTLYVEAVK